MNLKFRLALMNFLEFAVWGAYLTCMGNYLGVAGLGDKISWFYAIQGIVSIFMPTLMGIVADKYIQPQRLLGLCHLVAGAFMFGCWWLGYQAGFGQELSDKSLFIALYTLSVAFFMPTIALANTAAFSILKKNGMDTVKDFPPIRVLGTEVSLPLCGLSIVRSLMTAASDSRWLRTPISSSILTCSSLCRAC